MEFKELANKYVDFIDKSLEEVLVAESQPPQIIHKAMRYSVFAGGKRLRPMLCLMAGEIFGAKREELARTASALELIHTYSLIHDDHPDLDNDSLRRGLPTNHIVFGNAMAILAGDALLTQAFEILANESLREEDPEKQKRRIKVNLEIARAVGSMGMIGGQVVDIISEDSPKKEESVLHYIHSHKTGELISASLRSGALIGGASKEELFYISGYAEKIGLAFQITDDILDIKGDEAALGKDKGSDQEKNKLTWPSIYGLEESELMAEKAIKDAKAFLKKLDKDCQGLEILADYILSRNS